MNRSTGLRIDFDSPPLKHAPAAGQVLLISLDYDTDPISLDPMFYPAWVENVCWAHDDHVRTHISCARQSQQHILTVVLQLHGFTEGGLVGQRDYFTDELAASFLTCLP